MRRALVIPAAFLASALVVRGIIAYAPAGAASGLRQPLAVATDWHAFGAMLVFAVVLGLAAAMLAYLRVRGAANAMTSLPAIVATVAGSLACAWALPVVFSSDVYAYAAYGELALLGANPYAHALLPGGNAIFDAAIVQWGNPPPPCLYGTPFVWIAAAIVGIARPFGTSLALNGFRLLASGALVACTLLAYVAYGGGRARRLAAAATIGLNPVVIWSAAEGHNDTLVLAIVLAGFACAQRGLTGIGAFLAAGSGAIKIPGVIAALPLAMRERRATVGATLGALAALALSLPVLSAATHQLAPHGRYAPQASFGAIVDVLAAMLGATERQSAWIAWAVAAVAAGTFTVAAVRRLRRDDATGWAQLAVAGWLLVPNPYPWYGIWLVAIAAALPQTRGATALLGLSFASLLRYVPDAVATPRAPLALLLAAAATLPALGLLLPRNTSDIING
ncbi:MAG: DUF2029 domain-containing protein [Candidatus Eremiobacteraeota bacterium]|nr:DUF2029 domain-containing protein [Candidatus Eremiobacteraeota bacterium]